jgi:predicted phage tail protein
MTKLQREMNGEPSTLELVRTIGDDLATLMRKEVELAKEEMLTAILARVKAAAGLAVGGVLGLLGLLFAALGGAAALGLVLPWWAAALIVAGAFWALMVLGLSFALVRAKRPPMAPTETIRTIKEDVEWSRKQLKK